MTELHPELEAVIRDVVASHRRAPWKEASVIDRLVKAADAHLPAPDFGEQVLAHLPKGWEVDECTDGSYGFCCQPQGMTELHPELEKALRDWRAANEWCSTTSGAPPAVRLYEAIDAHLPALTFSRQVLARLPDGWTTFEGDEWASFRVSGLDIVGFAHDKSADPAAVAKALLLLAGR